jgi:hypothetical protein
MDAYLLSMHSRLVITITLLFAFLALWGLIGYLRHGAAGRIFRSFLMIGQLLIMAEFGIGVALFASGYQAAEPLLHVVYAVVAVLALPAAHLYARQRPPRNALLIYTVTAVFLCGVALRALDTGR